MPIRPAAPAYFPRDSSPAPAISPEALRLVQDADATMSLDLWACDYPAWVAENQPAPAGGLPAGAHPLPKP